jgi:hypothetical protein
MKMSKFIHIGLTHEGDGRLTIKAFGDKKLADTWEEANKDAFYIDVVRTEVEGFYLEQCETCELCGDRHKAELGMEGK